MARAGTLPGWPRAVPALLEREAAAEPDADPGDPGRPAGRPVPDVSSAARRDTAAEDRGESPERGDGLRSTADRRAARHLRLPPAPAAAIPRRAGSGAGL